jgi:predicted trehalose synthase
MKIRWWLVGSVALAVGGALLLSQLLSDKGRIYSIDDGEDSQSLGEFPPVIPDSPFEEIDFLA